MSLAKGKLTPAFCIDESDVWHAPFCNTITTATTTTTTSSPTSPPKKKKEKNTGFLSLRDHLPFAGLILPARYPTTAPFTTSLHSMEISPFFLKSLSFGNR